MFQCAIVPHASHKANQFVDGLPEHIRIEVELRDPRDLQTTMHLTQAYACCAEVTPPAPAQSLARPPQLLALALPPTARVAADTPGAPATPAHVLQTPLLLTALPMAHGRSTVSPS